jgi:hypothetical protein
VPLYVWWSAARNDTFVTPTQCAECPPGAYVLLGVAGFIFQTAAPGRVALNCYWAPAYLDALLATAPPSDPAYSFVRLEGFALADPQQGALPLRQEARNYSKAAREYMRSERPRTARAAHPNRNRAASSVRAPRATRNLRTQLAARALSTRGP